MWKIFDVIYEQRVWMFQQGNPNTRKHDEKTGPKTECFYCFRLFGFPWWNTINVKRRVVHITSQSNTIVIGYWKSTSDNFYSRGTLFTRVCQIYSEILHDVCCRGWAKKEEGDFARRRALLRKMKQSIMRFLLRRATRWSGLLKCSKSGKVREEMRSDDGAGLQPLSTALECFEAERLGY